MPEEAAVPTPKLTIETSVEGGVTLVRCKGRLFAGSIEPLQTEIRRLIPGAKRIVLDLTDLTYMDSIGLGAIIGLYVSAKTAGCRLEMINLSKRVRELFSITNVLSLFEAAGEHNMRMP